MCRNRSHSKSPFPIRSSLEKYLSTGAEKLHSLYEDNILRTFDCVLIVPACGESLTPLLTSVDESAQFCQKSVLVIIVVNDTPSTLTSFQLQNRHYLSDWGAGYREFTSSVGLLNIDCTQGSLDAFDKKDGVGRARKIGNDVALSCFYRGLIREPLLHQTDGDATVALDYFLSVPVHLKGALIHPYEHLLDPSDTTSANALKLYDQYLKYHAEGMQRAHPHYAYAAIGSLISVDVLSYVQVRGFPKLEAGEDFYFLNKIAKVAEVRTGSTGKITLHPRKGIRVPFGTNASVEKIASLSSDYFVYHPALYLHIQSLRQKLEAWCEHQDNDRFIQSLLPAEAAWAESKQVRTVLEKALKQNTSTNFLKRFVRDWFDAFRVLKAMHLAETDWPKLPLEAALILARELGFS